MLSNAMVRATAMTGVPAIIRELGGDPTELLARYNLREEMIRDPKQMMPYVRLIQLLEQAATEFDCEDFGLQVGLRQGLNVLGPIAVIAQNSCSPDDAIRNIIKYIGYHSPAVQLALDPVLPGKNTAVHFDIALTQCPSRAQTVEMSLVLAMQVIRVLVGEHFTPSLVCFRHQRRAPAARYRSIFGCPVEFGSASNALYIPAENLRQPISESDPGLRQVMEDYVTQKIKQHTKSFGDSVRTLVIMLLPMEQRCTISLIARHLAISERTLQRGLKREGLVFEEVVDAVRQELAADYLREPGMAMSQVAGLLGYGQQSSFNRACQRWFGKSPKLLRQDFQSA